MAHEGFNLKLVTDKDSADSEKSLSLISSKLIVIADRINLLTGKSTTSESKLKILETSKDPTEEQ